MILSFAFRGPLFKINFGINIFVAIKRLTRVGRFLYKNVKLFVSRHQSVMARSGVMFSVVITMTATISQVWGACSDYTCSYNPDDGKSKVTMTIDSGDNCAYNTQAGDSYPPPRGYLSGRRSELL